jgi:hypothetical protein
VRVGPADTERRDPSATWPVLLKPRHLLGEQLDVARNPVYLAVGLIDMQSLGKRFVADSLDHLDDAADPAAAWV